MKRFGLLLLLCAWLTLRAAHSASADNAPQPLASYKIEVELKLDGQQHPRLLTGTERLSWLNDSPDAISELQFHLYLNAFKKSPQLFLRRVGAGNCAVIPLMRTAARSSGVGSM